MNIKEYYMNIAREIAKASTNASTKVGCVIVNEKGHILTSGYNDLIKNIDMKYMTDEKPMYYMLDIHAEMRAILNADVSLKGTTLYCTISCCDNCFKHIIECGIKEVVYDNLFTNGKSTGSIERLEAVVRLIKGSGVMQTNIKGKTYIEDLKDNGIEFNI
ncbi:MAG: hypothetical protein LBC92_00550 [Rickettsiales bacterium]|jgi:deoxycytidylate deaminase|nr:hypothetical protein [Rickettsiales bacterium]